MRRINQILVFQPSHRTSSIEGYVYSVSHLSLSFGYRGVCEGTTLIESTCVTCRLHIYIYIYIYQADVGRLNNRHNSMGRVSQHKATTACEISSYSLTLGVVTGDDNNDIPILARRWQTRHHNLQYSYETYDIITKKQK